MKMNQIKRTILVLLTLVTFCFSKKFLLETELNPTWNKTYNEQIPNDRQYDDYMADVSIRNVDVGTPVELRCNSPKRFSACFFSKKGSNVYYKIQPKFQF